MADGEELVTGSTIRPTGREGGGPMSAMESAGDGPVERTAGYLQAILGIVRAVTGHDFSSYKTNTILRRIGRRMTINGINDKESYVALLKESPQEAEDLSREFLIGVTGFFRDPAAFEILRRDVIPKLFADRGPGSPLRIWHACCATGEEVYSTAILILEYLVGPGLDAKAQIFATDLDEGAIAQARSGIYPEGIRADVSEERLKTFFAEMADGWQVSKQLREMIVFAHHNLIKDPPFSRLDLVVCRNFLIYLDSEMQRRVISLFRQVLKPGGFLFLGGSETVAGNSAHFIPVSKKWKIFRLRDNERPADMQFTPSLSVPALTGPGRPWRPAGAAEKSPGAMAEQILMERYSPPCVVVNERCEVVYVSTRIGGFLEVPVGEPTRDILKMVREELRPALRTAIHRAFSEREQVAFRGIRVRSDGGDRTINLLVEPLGVAPGETGKAMVVFEPSGVPDTVSVPGAESDTVRGGETDGDSMVRQLEEQLRVTHEQLRATVDQLQTSNEAFMTTNDELIAINEEYQSTNEELQATNEELETSKEELQALNEELATINAELQANVEELNILNSDMENLFASSRIASIFLDRQLIIRRFSPAMADIFNLIQADIGRPFRHMAGTIDWHGLADDAAKVLEGSTPEEREVAGVDTGRKYLMRVLPCLAAEGGVDGVVVTLIDITELKRAEEAKARLAAVVESSDDAIIAKDLNGVVLSWNAGAERMFGYTAREVLGRPITFLFPSELLDEETGILRHLSDGERLEHYETKRNTKDGRQIDVSIAVSPIKDSFGRVIGVSKIARDITERKRAVEALRESEERVRLKLESILAPEGEIGNLELADIIDSAAIQSLVEDFFSLARVPMGLIDLKGNVLAGVGWQDICTKFHRQHPETRRHCIESDTRLSAGIQEGEYKLYKCMNNMWDAATPIMVGGRHFGNLFIGQFFFDGELPDFGMFRSQAAKYGFHEEEYVAALEAVPRISRETLDTAMAYFTKLAAMISRLSYSNIKLARILAERETLMHSLRGSEQRLARAQEIACLGSWELDLVDNRLSWSDEVYRIFGMKPREFDANYEAFLRAVHPDDRAAVDAAYSGSLREGRDSYEIEHRVVRRSDGQIRIVHEKCEHIRDESGRIVKSVGMVHDITERKRAEVALRESEERLRLFIVHAPAGLAMFDRDMRYLYLSRRWRDDYGLGERDIIGVSHYEIFPEIGEAWKEAHRRGLAGEVLRAEADRFQRADGSVQWIRWEIRPWRDSAGNVEGIVIFSEDITGRKQAEEELRAAKEAAEAATRAKSRFLANMSHELRTPMNGVLGMLDHALNGSLEGEQREFIETARKSAGSLLHILNDILDLTKVEAGKLAMEKKPFPLRECVAGAVDILQPEARRKGLRLTQTAALEVPETIVGDEVRLCQVLTNLVGNAVKFTDHGNVEVGVGMGAVTQDGRGELIFTVTDTGIGIPADSKDVLFRPFSQVDDSSTRRHGETGLGLAISREIVERMGGTITVESKEGVGSRFTFTVVFEAAGAGSAAEQVRAAAAATEPRHDNRETAKGFRLLVAEDDPVGRQVLKVLFKRQNLEPDFVADGLQAVEKWENGDYDLILMDVQMPRMDGFEATRSIRDRESERGGRTPIVAMTAHAFAEDEQRCLDAGMDAYITKPVDFKKCLEVIGSILGNG